MARKVPLLKPAHAQARLKFAHDHLADLEESWEKALWSEGLNSTRCVWRTKNDEHHPKNTIPNVKHGGGASCCGGVSLHMGQDDCTVLRRGGPGKVLKQELMHEDVPLSVEESRNSTTRPWNLVQEPGEITLQDYLQSNSDQKTSPTELLRDVLKDLEFAHRRDIIHGDVRHQNVVVDNKGRAKLIFGKCQRIEDDQNYQGELQKSGELAYYILSGGGSYYKSDSAGSWTNKDIVLDFTEGMTHPDPTKRRSVQEALQHPIFWTDERKQAYLKSLANLQELKQPNNRTRDDQQFKDDAVGPQQSCILILVTVFSKAAIHMNVYEDTVVRSRMEMSECSKTEDVYQTLHRPPAVSIPNSTHEPVRPRRLKTMLPIFNTLLLVAIVVMLGLHDWIMAFHPYPLRCHAQEAISQLDSYVHCRSMATDMALHGLAMETPSNPSRKSVRALALFWLMRLPILFSSSWCQRSKSDFFDLNDGGLKALQPLTLCQRDTTGGTATKQSLPALLMGMVELRPAEGVNTVCAAKRLAQTYPVANEPRSTEVNNPQASGVVEGNKREELWRLHGGVFYLFWEAEGNCTAAVKFCEDRNSEVVTIHNSEGQNTEGSGHSDYDYLDFYFNTNPDLLATAPSHYCYVCLCLQDWILSQANGRKLWINIVGVTTTHLNESLYHCPPDDENSDTMQGWVCESPQRPNFGFFHRKMFRDHFFLDTPTELPESSASTAVSVHSVKVYVITASVLSLLCPLRRLFT
ncbi:hypothetical protein NFI96_024506, partial [Prochilodus magdalenae]